ncbi:MAG: anthranilate synthase component I family protein [Pseudomonadota bacterium]
MHNLQQSTYFYPTAEQTFALAKKIRDMGELIWLHSGRETYLKTHLPSRYDILSADPLDSLLFHGGKIFDDNKFFKPKNFLTVTNALIDGPVPGYFGYASYSAPQFSIGLKESLNDELALPSVDFKFYSWIVVIDHRDQCMHIRWSKNTDLQKLEKIKDIIATLPEIYSENQPWKFTFPKASMSDENYTNAFHNIKNWIQAGDIYQVNLAQHFTGQFNGDPLDVFYNVATKHPMPFAAYLEKPWGMVASHSPELFVQIKEDKITSIPIKGTAPRSSNITEDQNQADNLKKSIKNRAENIMIVDLIRNDLSKYAFNVQVDKLFDIESYPSVHHLVSHVIAKRDIKTCALDIAWHAFPGGSITGAPKKRAMEIINEIEPVGRSLYCGSIGYWNCYDELMWNINIRTIIYIKTSTQHFNYFTWSGSGIVADSEPQAEYQECLDKLQWFTRYLDSSHE